MSKKSLTLTSFQIIVKDDVLNFDDIIIPKKDIVKLSPKKDKSFSYSCKISEDERFFIIDEIEAEKEPYSPTSYNFNSLKSCDTQRDPFVGEFNKHSYYVIDFDKSVVWLNDVKKETKFMKIMNEVLGVNSVKLKSIFDRDSFMEALSYLDSLSVTASPDLTLFSDTTLSNALRENVYMDNADQIKISVLYGGDPKKRKGMIRGLYKKKKITKLFEDPTYKSIVISGRDCENQKIVLDSANIVRKVKLSVNLDNHGVYQINDILEQISKELVYLYE